MSAQLLTKPIPAQATLVQATCHLEVNPGDTLVLVEGKCVGSFTPQGAGGQSPRPKLISSSLVLEQVISSHPITHAGIFKSLALSGAEQGAKLTLELRRLAKEGLVENFGPGARKFWWRPTERALGQETGV